MAGRLAVSGVLLGFALAHCGAPQVHESAARGEAGAELADARAEVESASSPETRDASAGERDASAGEAAVDSSLEAEAGDAGDAGRERICSRRVLGQSARRAACSRDDQCVLRPAGCCPPCGAVPPSQARAVDTGDDVLCTMPCPACATGFPSSLKAECVKRRCVVVETTCEGPPSSSCPRVRPPTLLPRVMPPELATCAVDSHCALRVEKCCHCGLASGNDVIALHRGKKLACKGQSARCPDCAGEGVDPTLRAVCVGGLCRVQDQGLDPSCSDPLLRQLVQ